MADGFKVSIKGPGINVEREVPEAQANALLVALLTGKPPAPSGDPSHPPASKANASTGGAPGALTTDVEADSLAGYLAAANARTGPEKITCIGAYLKKYEKVESFDRSALEERFPAAGESVPKNLPRDLKEAVRRGWIASKVGEAGTYYVTGSGLKAISGHFEGASTRKGAARRKKKQTKSS
jgi:hypothetical protein